MFTSVLVKRVDNDMLNSVKTSKSHNINKKVVPMYNLHKNTEGNMVHSGLLVNGIQNYMASD